MAAGRPYGAQGCYSTRASGDLASDVEVGVGCKAVFHIVSCTCTVYVVDMMFVDFGFEVATILQSSRWIPFFPSLRGSRFSSQEVIARPLQADRVRCAARCLFKVSRSTLKHSRVLACAEGGLSWSADTW
jgi:hypothetical protein